MSEQPTYSQAPPALRPLTRTQDWVRRAVSPWAQRALADRLQRRPDRVGALAGSDASRLSARLQRRAAHRLAWSIRAGGLSPNMVQRFAGAVTGRFTLPMLSRLVERSSTPAGQSPIEMPLVGGVSASDAQAPALELVAQPAVDLDNLAAAPMPTGLPPLGAQWAGRRAASASPATQSVSRARPPVVPGEPRPTAGRIRRYARVEEIDPATLAAENERRRVERASFPDQAAESPDTARRAQPSETLAPARPASIQRRAERQPTALPPRPLSTEIQPASALRGIAPSEPQPSLPDIADALPSPGAEPPSVSVLQRLRQARAAQLRRKAEQDMPAARPAAPVSPSPVAGQPDLSPAASSSPVSPPAVSARTGAAIPRAPLQPSVRRSVELPVAGEVLPGEQEAGDTLPAPSSLAQPAGREAPPQVTPAARTLETSAPTEVPGKAEPTSAPSPDQPSPGAPPAQATLVRATQPPAWVQRSAAAGQPPEGLPASQEQATLPESPRAEVAPAGQPTLARPSIQRGIEVAADEAADAVAGVSEPSQASLATTDIELPAQEVTADAVRAAFARRVASRVESAARLPVSLNPSVAVPDSAPPAVRREPQAQEAAPGPDRPVVQRRRADVPDEAAQPRVAPQASVVRDQAAATELGQSPVSRAADQPAALAPGVMPAEAPAPGLPLFRHARRAVAVQRSPAVLPQARAPGQLAESDRADEGDRREARAPTDAAMQLSDRQPARRAVPVARPLAGVQRRPANTAQPAVIKRGAGVENDAVPKRNRWDREAARPALPLAAPMRAPRVQRAPEDRPAPAAPSAPREPAQTRPAGAPDLQALARRVYPILKRMLAVERERMRGA